jgi:hypothetical protein
MRRLWISVALVLAAVLGSPVSAHAAKRDRCAESGSRTVAQNKFVRVYSTAGTLKGCLRRTGQTRTLHRPTLQPNEFGGAGLVAVNRARVAWVTAEGCTVCGGGGQSAHIQTRDLRRGPINTLRLVRDHDENDLYGDAVDALAVDSCGRVAYRSVVASIHGGVAPDPELSVWTADGRRVLDRGDVDRRTLSIRADLVNWSRDGFEHSAPVAGPCFG